MVPITVIAFVIGLITLGKELGAFTVWDGVGLCLVGVGVFLFNAFEERKQKASIENIWFLYIFTKCVYMPFSDYYIINSNSSFNLSFYSYTEGDSSDIYYLAGVAKGGTSSI